MPIILGIETSCDETAVALVEGTQETQGCILSHVVRTQLAEHKEYGGVVPEIAARAHMDLLLPMVQQALVEAKLSLEEVAAIAATCGPGLLGGVMVGSMAAKTLAMVFNKPFVAVNHLEGHAQVCRLTNAVDFPFLLLLISGGHCQFLEVFDLGSYRLLGQTLDDSAGEAFDKMARLLELGYPGGPLIEKWAQKGDPHRFSVSLPLAGRPGCDLSFSGLKTAFRLLIQQEAPLSDSDRSDMAASIQEHVALALASRTVHAFEAASQAVQKARTFVVAGGVAANQRIRSVLQDVAQENGFRLIVPPPALCTDNAVMIAWVGLCKALRGQFDDLSVSPRPRWPLDRS